MSFPFEKPPNEKSANTPDSYESEANWAAFDALDDEDILIDEDCPEMLASDFERGTLRFNGREPTREEIKEGIRIIEDYFRRQSETKKIR